MSTQILSPASAAAKLGVTVETLRRWERQGKLASDRTLGGHRRYSSTEIDRLQQAKTKNLAAEGGEQP